MTPAPMPTGDIACFFREFSLPYRANQPGRKKTMPSCPFATTRQEARPREPD